MHPPARQPIARSPWWKALTGEVRLPPFGLVLATGVVAFGGLALAARAMPYFAFDPPVSRAVQSVQAPWLDRLAAAVSWIGYPPQVDVLVAGLALGLWLLGRRWQAAAVAVAGAGAGGLYLLTQQLVDRPRPSPDLVRVAVQLPNSAFPSGHEATLTAVLGFLAFWCYTSCPTLAGRWLSVLAVGLGLLVLALARVYEGEHWASDVLGGFCLGCVWLAVTIHLYRWARQRSSRTRRGRPQA